MQLSKRSTKIPKLSDLIKLKPEIVKSAQSVYDDWEQDDDNEGGICDQIADVMAGVLSDQGYETDEGGHDGDDHAYVVIRTSDTHGFVIDIPWQLYEKKRGMYNYRKIPNVKLSAADVVIEEF